MQPAYAKIAGDPRFADLVSRRNRFAVSLSLIVLAVFSAFVFVAVALPGFFAARLGESSPWTWGLIGGWLIQIFAFLITGVYTLRANSEFDPAVRAIVQEATQ
ncbi:DUF485 domain-containing protein [Rhizobiaceae bacterium BDR2-2]|uniref:DUF485 domain-containing protein n=1 Tax=Ectorhizobium quercum TaxID=2965071 RepID=A0AAE3MYX1_9HYPH|nr:DUF485 domain-containing protein [Ectorhizobium quercum]MCX8996629.1 DUF485 domain-containing protein [Ectorhizobium quercum]